MISLREKQVRDGVYVVEVMRDGVYLRRATGGDRESAISALKRDLRQAVSEGLRAQEILSWLDNGPVGGEKP